MSFKYLDHGADIGLEVTNDSLEGLFSEAGRALFSLMVDIEGIQRDESLELELSEQNLEDLLYEWLSELLSLSNLNGQVYGEFSKVTITEAVSGYGLEAVARGENIDPEKHELGTEVKAVTYQGLEINDTEDGWRCRFVVDV
ncbi:MAG: archease [Candidatus Bipolaricaulota bacterium]|nr:archease [Candidatus Bipolaricaulota bacterium]MBS3792470.1 archease [Candidatus Bipolaricaulota bacterium]